MVYFVMIYLTFGIIFSTVSVKRTINFCKINNTFYYKRSDYIRLATTVFFLWPLILPTDGIRYLTGLVIPAFRSKTKIYLGTKESKELTWK